MSKAITRNDLIEASVLASRLRVEVASLCSERWAQDPDSQVGGFDQRESDLNAAAGLLEALSSEIADLWGSLKAVQQAIPKIPA